MDGNLAVSVPVSPDMPAAMRKALGAECPPGGFAAFGRLWQDRVEKILTAPDTYSGLVEVRPLAPDDPHSRA